MYDQSHAAKDESFGRQGRPRSEEWDCKDLLDCQGAFIVILAWAIGQDVSSLRTRGGREDWSTGEHAGALPRRMSCWRPFPLGPEPETAS